MSADVLRRAANITAADDQFTVAFGGALASLLNAEAVMAEHREALANQASDEIRANISPSYDASTVRALAVARAYLGEGP